MKMEKLEKKTGGVSKEELIQGGFRQHSSNNGVMYKLEDDGKSIVYLREQDGFYKLLKR